MVNLSQQLLGGRLSVREIATPTDLAVPDMLRLNYSIRTPVIAVDLFEATIVWSSMASIGTQNH